MVIDTLKLLTSDNVDYANKRHDYYGSLGNVLKSWEAGGAYTSGIISEKQIWSYWRGSIATDGKYNIYINFSYGNSYNETRPKSKFFSLLIYAGYPIT